MRVDPPACRDTRAPSTAWRSAAMALACSRDPASKKFEQTTRGDEIRLAEGGRRERRTAPKTGAKAARGAGPRPGPAGGPPPPPPGPPPPRPPPPSPRRPPRWSATTGPPRPYEPAPAHPPPINPQASG